MALNIDIKWMFRIKIKYDYKICKNTEKWKEETNHHHPKAPTRNILRDEITL